MYFTSSRRRRAVSVTVTTRSRRALTRDLVVQFVFRARFDVQISIRRLSVRHNVYEVAFNRHHRLVVLFCNHHTAPRYWNYHGNSALLMSLQPDCDCTISNSKLSDAIVTTKKGPKWFGEGCVKSVVGLRQTANTLFPGPQESPPETDLDLFSRFWHCRRVTDRLNRQIHHATGTSVAIVSTSCIRCGLTTHFTSKLP